jgi:multidrug transporter EmrE-like cation transporter
MLVPFYAFLVLAVVLEGSADLLLRKWGLDRAAGGGRWVFFALSLAVYMGGAVCWGLSLQYREVSRGIVAFAVLNVLAVAVAGVFLYGEELSPVNRVGIALGLCSLVLVEL